MYKINRTKGIAIGQVIGFDTIFGIVAKGESIRISAPLGTAGASTGTGNCSGTCAP